MSSRPNVCTGAYAGNKKPCIPAFQYTFFFSRTAQKNSKTLASALVLPNKLCWVTHSISPTVGSACAGRWVGGCACESCGALFHRGWIVLVCRSGWVVPPDLQTVASGHCFVELTYDEGHKHKLKPRTRTDCVTTAGVTTAGVATCWGTRSWQASMTHSAKPK